MATTITKTEKLVGKRIRRREDPRLITGTATYVDDIKMPGMHLRGDCAQPACRGEDPLDRHQQSRGDCRACAAVFTGEDTENVGAGAVRRVAAGAARPASSHSGDGSRVFRGASGGGGGRDRPLHRARRGGSDRSRLRRAAGGGRSGKGARAGRAAGASAVAGQHRVQLSPGRRRRRQGVRRGRRGREAAHHQPAPDSEGHGNARRGGRVARGGPRS